MAERRLRSVEKKLKQDESLAQAYQSVIDDYESKGYIREVPQEEPKPSSEWFLPHFPVVRPEKAIIKVRIVFDGSDQQNGKSLNSESLPGPKLQSKCKCKCNFVYPRSTKELKELVQKWPCIPGSNWNLEMLVFEERGKPEYPEKNLTEQSRKPTTNSTHI